MTQATGHIRPRTSKKQTKPTRPAKADPAPAIIVNKDGTGSFPLRDAPRGAFGLVVKGDCLAPKVRDGQILVIRKGLPKPGELVVIWAQGAPMPIVKVLTHRITGFPHHPGSNVVCGIELEQLNPPKRYRVWADKIDRIMSVHSVVEAPR